MRNNKSRDNRMNIRKDNMSKEKTVKNNTTLFRKTVRDFNKEYGYNFVLPKDTDYSSKYAHPVHEDGDIVITAQIDDYRDDPYVYGQQLKKAGITILSFSPKHDGMTYERLKKAISTPQFEYRYGVMKQLLELSTKLTEHIQEVRDSLLTNTIHDIEKEDSYDLAVQVAKELYKSHKES